MSPRISALILALSFSACAAVAQNSQPPFATQTDYDANKRYLADNGIVMCGVQLSGSYTGGPSVVANHSWPPSQLQEITVKWSSHVSKAYPGSRPWCDVYTRAYLAQALADPGTAPDSWLPEAATIAPTANVKAARDASDEIRAKEERDVRKITSAASARDKANKAQEAMQRSRQKTCKGSKLKDGSCSKHLESAPSR